MFCIFLISLFEQFVATAKETPTVDRPHKKEGEIRREGLRLQDRELQEMSDEGMCLSMHQPWASLLVKGIKWY